MKLGGKIALITGGCSGIGLATVETFLREGAKVVAADIQDERGRALEARFGPAFRYVPCDVSDEGDLAAATARAEQEFGGLDILFSNAGIPGEAAGARSLTAAQWDHAFAVMVRAPVLGMRNSVPLMLKRGGGAIVNTASIAGLQAGWGYLAYSTAKAAVIQLTRCAAAELSPRGIRVNAVSPGLIATPIFGALLGQDASESDHTAARSVDLLRTLQPVPKAGLPEDVAAAVLFLVSSEAAFVTGANLVVDGGITVGPRHSWDRDVPQPLMALRT